MAFDPNAFLIAIALSFAIIAFLIVLVIYISERLYKTKADPYVSSLPARVISAIVDIVILVLLIELLLTAANPSYNSIILFHFDSFFVNPSLNILMIVGICLSSYLFFYIPLFGASIFSITSLLITIFSFLYFFVCEAFLGGRTIGRFIFRVKTLHESKSRSIFAKEALILAIGKTFLLLDLAFGFMGAICYTHNSRLRQIRLSQRVAGTITVSTSFDFESIEEDDSDSFLNEDGKKWEGWDFK
jgi:hypothetical protein